MFIISLKEEIAMTYMKRAAEGTIARVAKMFPVLLVTGPRQVGKTRLLQRLSEEQKMVNRLRANEEGK